MSWKRQTATLAELPEKPSLIVWLFFGIISLVAGVLLFVLHSNQLLGVLQQYNLWLIAACPMFFWYFLICLRSWRYNQLLDKYQFELEEAGYAQQQWTLWAGRYAAVLHHGVILPRYLTSGTLLNPPVDLEQVIKQAIRINLKVNKSEFFLLLDSVRGAINKLPAELPVNVTLLTDSHGEDQILREIFSEAWHSHISSGRLVPLVNVLNSKSFSFLNERLKSPGLDVDLILIHQTQGGEKYSDALAVLLLTSDDVATKYELEHHARLLRPMSLGADQVLSAELDTFFSTQSQFIAARAVVGDSMEWGDNFSTLLACAKKYEGCWTTQQCYWLEKYAGLSGPFSPWIMAAAASDIAMLTKESCLMLSRDDEQRFVNTVTTGNIMHDKG